jgi:hypothetical protein
MMYLIHCKNFCKCHNVPPTKHKKGKKMYLADRNSQLGKKIKKKTLKTMVIKQSNRKDFVYFLTKRFLLRKKQNTI